MAYDWPGNVRQLRNVVRQLRNVARQLAVASRGAEVMQISSRVARMLADDTDTAIPAPDAGPPRRKTRAAPKKYRDPNEVGEDELIATLRDHQYRLKPTAEALGVSRASLYVLIDACPKIRKASDLSREEIEAAAKRSTAGGQTQGRDGRPEAMAKELEVSKQGLKMRMKELGLR